MNFGAVYENTVAQELAAAGVPLRYFCNSRKGEADFLLEDLEGRVMPVEVKPGRDYKLHTAPNTLQGTREWGVEEAFVLSEANVHAGERQGRPVWCLPLYMAFCLAGKATARKAGPAGSAFLFALDAAPSPF